MYTYPGLYLQRRLHDVSKEVHQYFGIITDQDELLDWKAKLRWSQHHGNTRTGSIDVLFLLRHTVSL